ncbi:integrase catalytic domain-containing protein [Nephila pilipes]|uniref:Integrase catalytic domain-containing protein n=1 Tax=Nephila pilipes TaxID=299642 RepID=A0A8X6U898_NEPPI|nr:integrase catalytic domain-containing protein [Nephila pilipes]
MVQYLPVSKRFDEVHLDIVSPLPSSEEKWYCVTLIHRFMQWPEAFPVPDIQAVTVASAVYIGWNSCFGMPSVVITDQGSQFESNLFTKPAHVLGIKWKRTRANNPVCNGFVDSWHLTLKTVITCHA